MVSQKAIHGLGLFLEHLIESGCHVERDSSFQSVPTATWTQINMDTEDWDIDSEFDLASDQYTAKRNGYIIATGWVIFKTMHDNARVIAELRKNGTRFGKAQQAVATANPVGVDQNVAFAGATDIAIGDTVDLYVFHDNGANVNVKGYLTILYVLKA